MTDISVEFLELNGFKLKPFSDGKFWIRKYTAWYYLQADINRTQFFEYDGGDVEQLTDQDFIFTINTHNQAINE